MKPREIFQDILRISKANAGYVILVAQLVDAVFNLWVGNECDKVTILGKYGRRKGWHVFGTILIIIAMIFNYTPPFQVSITVLILYTLCHSLIMVIIVQ